MFMKTNNLTYLSNKTKRLTKAIIRERTLRDNLLTAKA